MTTLALAGKPPKNFTQLTIMEILVRFTALVNAVVLVILFALTAFPADAQDASPGGACAGADVKSFDPVLYSSTGHLLVCNNGFWTSIISHNAGGDALFGRAVSYTSDISPASIGANQNDYAPTGNASASVMRLTAGAAYNITGLAGGTDGRILTLFNIGTNTITLKAEDAASTAANRFDIGSDIALAAEQAAVLIYDASSSRWRAMARPGTDDYQIFTANGTWTKPAGVTNCHYEMWGGGGGGGGVSNTSGRRSAGGGGGAYFQNTVRASSLGATEPVVVGGGGSAGTTAGTDGGIGGNSSFDGFTIFGGGGGVGGAIAVDAGGGGGGGYFTAGATGTGATHGQGGEPDDANGAGGYNLFGGGQSPGSGAIYGGGAGRSATSLATLMDGRPSLFGGGGGGGGSAGGSSPGGASTHGGSGGASGFNSNGTAGSVPGGGGGGTRTGAATGYTGGAGARGEVRVRCW